MRELTQLRQLEAEISTAEQQRAVSDDAFRQSLSEWYLSPKVCGAVPSDPFSPAFTAYQLGIYRSLTGKTYDPVNEETAFDFDHELTCPYPYGTRSPQTVGSHLIGWGWLIKAMDLPVDASILEIGSGYGGLTVHLASMGYRVTCLDISESLLAFVRARTAQLPQPIATLCGDMATVEINSTFDAVIFNASLHHCTEHRDVLRRMNALLAPGGLIAFAAEPVVPDDSPFVPYPWGVRLDGLSVWSIVKWGWLELGFQESYFLRILEEVGWRPTRHNLGLSGETDVWIATRTGDRQASPPPAYPAAGYDVSLEAEVVRLRNLVEGYESGRFIKLMKWLKRRSWWPGKG